MAELGSNPGLSQESPRRDDLRSQHIFNDCSIWILGPSKFLRMVSCVRAGGVRTVYDVCSWSGEGVSRKLDTPFSDCWDLRSRAKVGSVSGRSGGPDGEREGLATVSERPGDGPDRAVVGEGPVLSRAKLAVLDYDARQAVNRLERDRTRHVRALAYLDRQRRARTRELNAINRELARWDTKATSEIRIMEEAVGAGEGALLGGAGALAAVRAMTLEGSPVQRHVLETLRAAVGAGTARGSQKAVEGFTARDLVALTGRTLDSVRTALRCLHGLGYVERDEDAEDGRIIRWLPSDRA